MTMCKDLSVIQGSPNNFDRGPHKLEIHSPGAGHLAECDCFEKRCILPNQQIFHNHIIGSLLAKCLRGPEEMASRAGFGPLDILWRSLL